LANRHIRIVIVESKSDGLNFKISAFRFFKINIYMKIWIVQPRFNGIG